MTSVPIALPVLGLFLLQTPYPAKESRQQAQTVVLPPQTVSEPPSTTVPGEKAFGKLFEQVQQERAARQALANQRAERRVVCGMVVIEADPSIDPKILVPPAADSPTAKIRRIVPTGCAE